VREEFAQLLEDQWSADRYVCLGLDLDPARLPSHLAGNAIDRCRAFAYQIIDATGTQVAAYKPNFAFFEALGGDGISLLRDIVRYVHEVASAAVVIIDRKAADIGTSNEGTAACVFDYLEGDAVTLHNYLGHEALRPFLSRRTKGSFVLCRTSNPGAGEFQDVSVNGTPLFVRVARAVSLTWNSNGNVGLVAGATYPDELALVRAAAPELPLLIPGVGAQGGDLEASVRAAFSKSQLRVLVNASRSILYASSEPTVADSAQRALHSLSTQVATVVANLRNR
jgi:orotidine-5'-phosphate decarboxylase